MSLDTTFKDRKLKEIADRVNELHIDVIGHFQAAVGGCLDIPIDVFENRAYLTKYIGLLQLIEEKWAEYEGELNE